jgi:hypothetical protein
MIRSPQDNVTRGHGSGTHRADSLPRAARTIGFDALLSFTEVFYLRSRLMYLQNDKSYIGQVNAAYAILLSGRLFAVLHEFKRDSMSHVAHCKRDKYTRNNADDRKEREKPVPAMQNRSAIIERE